MLLGVLLGLAFMSRPQEALFALFPAALLWTAAAPKGDGSRRCASGRRGRLSARLPFLALQAVHSVDSLQPRAVCARRRRRLPGLLHSRWDDTLWSSWHGFLSWTPIAYVALVGTVAYHATLALGLRPRSCIVFVMAWVNGSTADWAAGWSFGGRRFTSCLVLLAPGLALVVIASAAADDRRRGSALAGHRMEPAADRAVCRTACSRPGNT